MSLQKHCFFFQASPPALYPVHTCSCSQHTSPVAGKNQCISSLTHSLGKLLSYYSLWCPLYCPEWQLNSKDSRESAQAGVCPQNKSPSIRGSDIPLHTGASIDFEHTSATYNHDKARSYWNWIRLWNYAQPPDVILEAGTGQGTIGDGQERASNRSWQ